MRILLLSHSFNSLTQRLHVELRERGHEVSVELDIHADVTRESVALYQPDLVIAPFLKRAIPEDVWRSVRCLIVHPGPPGDRGPAALDWAILEGATAWGVTVLQADGEFDAGPVWAFRTFPMRRAAKSSIYRNEVTQCAVEAVLEALDAIAAGRPTPQPMAANDARIRVRGPCRHSDRAIDWQHDTTETVLRKINSADGMPGLVDSLFFQDVRLFDVHEARDISGIPGTVVAQCDGALARATVDGAVWIGHVRQLAPKSLKRSAAKVFAAQAACLPRRPDCGYAPIQYREHGEVGELQFAFYNGAMSTDDCAALRDAYRAALARPTRVLLLTGGFDYWSNGIHLAEIEAADSAADESWRNINAIDDLARAIIETTDRLVISVIRGNAGAGGVFLSLAADEVWASDQIVLNPHYKDMGNLFGSEYWTYLLPRRAGAGNATRITQCRLPMGVAEAQRLGIVDRVLARDELARESLIKLAAATGADPGLAARLAEKQRRRATDEAEKPLQAYRDEELRRMRLNFYGFDPSYHVARYNFIHKVPKSRTPLTIAHHRARRTTERQRPVAVPS
ncbi:hydrogenase maturation protein [Bradyrhizobium sp. WBOS7]|uniref:Hydrogenase maturation protein n=1 Tax=Bradyrhizobium betae TaxID=244734 RepID=A0AAE9N8G7_9BRAD|nr:MULTISPECIES: hydrogenase maturation protein [Bradyrhizobium]MDD1571758.1 hydrogenase maturation protein [Bradyrhizobium sp. WBOS1]UUO36300.1 hydrogenase maturation protein [Bradyrhizobium sp. WBOS01]MDD1526622.1 hydrogenase maturation protein [Bradyrhizobium sp. WBOS2]MDD1575262.1 hydrogenase maturation protein [Bradyrhizobium sp. WBOS7]MDD1600725.1 hydrogenase maturation protein [Bradyrhizobium sp. WBOS16]